MKRALAVSAASLALGISAQAKPKPRCHVYFSVVQIGPSLPNGRAIRLNSRQKSWFEQHGDRGKLAGICYNPAKASYLIRWTAEQMERASGSLVVQALSASNDSSASGLLLRVGNGRTLVPLKTLTATSQPDGKHLSAQNSASVALLKEGLETIAKAQEAGSKSKSTITPPTS